LLLLPLQLTTRFIAFPKHGHFMIPLIDLANHQQDCPHTLIVGPCPFSSSRQCALWKAGADLSEGEEVCFFYKVCAVLQ
jgi:hypothetical protein